MIIKWFGGVAIDYKIKLMRPHHPQSMLWGLAIQSYYWRHLWEGLLAKRSCLNTLLELAILGPGAPPVNSERKVFHSFCLSGHWKKKKSQKNMAEVKVPSPLSLLGMTVPHMHPCLNCDDVLKWLTRRRNEEMFYKPWFLGLQAEVRYPHLFVPLWGRTSGG